MIIIRWVSLRIDWFLMRKKKLLSSAFECIKNRLIWSDIMLVAVVKLLRLPSQNINGLGKTRYSQVSQVKWRFAPSFCFLEVSLNIFEIFPVILTKKWPVLSNLFIKLTYVFVMMEIIKLFWTFHDLFFNFHAVENQNKRNIFRRISQPFPVENGTRAE